MRMLICLLVMAFCSTLHAGKCTDGDKPPQALIPTVVQRLGPEVVTSQTTEQVVERTTRLPGFERAPAPVPMAITAVPVAIVARVRPLRVGILRRLRDRDVDRTVTRKRTLRRGRATRSLGL